jgi:hypothetical protein
VYESGHRRSRRRWSETLIPFKRGRPCAVLTPLKPVFQTGFSVLKARQFKSSKNFIGISPHYLKKPIQNAYQTAGK